jgi:hypothetical protein
MSTAVQELVAGRELDVLVDSSLFGHTHMEEGGGVYRMSAAANPLLWEVPAYSTDPGAAQCVIEKVREWPDQQRYWFTVRLKWAVEERLEKNVTESNVVLYVEPEDICRAALKSVERDALAATEKA